MLILAQMGGRPPLTGSRLAMEPGIVEICNATRTMAPPKTSEEGREQPCHQPLGGLSSLAYVTRGSSRSKDLFFWSFR
jgi:hypothetical protein